MDVRLFRDRGLGNGSYLVRVADGRAVLVDPDRRTRRYLAAAEDRSLEIVAVLETHLHADFVSGALEIRAATGAEVYEPAEAGVSFPTARSSRASVSISAGWRSRHWRRRDTRRSTSPTCSGTRAMRPRCCSAVAR